MPEQISPADLRDMLRADAVGVALGGLLLVVGLITVVLWRMARPRARTLPARSRPSGPLLGIFAILYGLRLLVRTTTFRVVIGGDTAAWNYAEAALTYTIPIPLFLFVRYLIPIWRRLTYWSAVALALFAICAITSDAILRRPNSAITPNNLIAIALIAFLLVVIFRPGLNLSRELRTLRIGVTSWSLTVLVDNLRGISVLTLPGPDVEPFGFTVLVGCLGMLVIRRVVDDARRLAVINRELSIARQIQSSILPQAMPRVSGLTLVARYRPMNAVAGDFYDFIEIDGERLGVLVADVSGHGVPAALIASMVKVALAAQHERASSPAALLAGLNEALCGRLGGQYVTAAYLFIDTRSALIRYAAAGHPHMLRVARGSGDVCEVDKNGLLLGFMRAVAYDELELPLEVGDRLLLYTDGLIEAANATDELFGLERVKSALATSATLSPDAAADALLNTMETWSGRPAADDLTLVIVDTSPHPYQDAVHVA
jgi:sigma-B regulation protein RsbU (phosphoserine phosphatase)